MAVDATVRGAGQPGLDRESSRWPGDEAPRELRRARAVLWVDGRPSMERRNDGPLGSCPKKR
jgi:hypothetical protein